MRRMVEYGDLQLLLTRSSIGWIIHEGTPTMVGKIGSRHGQIEPQTREAENATLG